MKRDIPNEITKDSITQEAIARLRDLGLDESVVENYKNGIIMVSDTNGVFDFNSWIGKGMPEVAIEEAQRLHIHPYHVIYTWSNLGEFYDVLYVSNYPGDWEYERVDDDGYMMSYCYNSNEPDFSEVGTIRVNLKNNTITRTE